MSSWSIKPGSIRHHISQGRVIERAGSLTRTIDLLTTGALNSAVTDTEFRAGALELFVGLGYVDNHDDKHGFVGVTESSSNAGRTDLLGTLPAGSVIWATVRGADDEPWMLRLVKQEEPDLWLSTDRDEVTSEEIFAFELEWRPPTTPPELTERHRL